jgi:hypothetical protein
MGVDQITFDLLLSLAVFLVGLGLVLGYRVTTAEHRGPVHAYGILVISGTILAGVCFVLSLVANLQGTA